MKKILTILALITTLPLFAQQISTESFQTPPKENHISTWWHWMSGYITKEGITKDLEAMKEQGIQNATILNVDRIETPLKMHRVTFGSDEWFDMFHFALEEANRLGITIGTANCDGWSESGGPWIKPENSMKQFVWSKYYLSGGGKRTVQLPQPTCTKDFYKDAYVVAFRSHGPNSFDKAKPVISYEKDKKAPELTDGNPNTGIILREGPMTIAFNKTFTADVLSIIFNKTDKALLIPINISIEAANDTASFRKVTDLTIDKVNDMLKLSIPQTSAKYFRVKIKDDNKGNSVGEVYLLKKGEKGLFESNYSQYPVKTTAIRTQTMDNYWEANEIDSSSIIQKPEDVVDLSSFIDANGKLTWNAPKGMWTILRFGFTTTGVTNHPASPEGRGLECDKMDTTALNIHFQNYPQKIIDIAGKYKGNTFKYFLVDSWEARMQNWTDLLGQEFEKRRGYSIVPYIPVLCGEVVQSSECVEAFLHDFRLTIGELLQENYFKHLADLCHRQGIQLYSEGIYGQELTPPIDVLQTYKYCDVPMSEFWAKIPAHTWPFPTIIPQNLGFVIPEHSALLYNKPIVAGEAYTGYAIFSDSPIDLKTYGDQAFSEGINSMVLHSYVHQPDERTPGFTLGIYGQTFNRHNTWFRYAKGFFDEQARIQYMMQGGSRFSDALLYIGDKKPAIECYDKELSQVLPPNTKFNYINQEVLLNRLTVNDGQILLDNKYVFQFMSIRDKELDLVTMQKIEALVNDGAIVFMTKPERTLTWKNYSSDCTALKVIADKMWENMNAESGIAEYGKGKIISSLDALMRIYDADLTIRGTALDSLLYLHKQRDDSDIYFLSNKCDTTALEFNADFRQRGKYVSIWDPMNGKIYAVTNATENNGRTACRISLRPRQSVFVVFTKKDIALTSGEIYKTSGQIEHLSKDILFFRTAKGTMSFVDDSSIQNMPINGFTSFTESKNELLKYYSGEVVYRMTLNIPKQYVSKNYSLYLQLPAFGSTAHIEINGSFVTDLWDPTYKANITKLVRKGDNEFVIKVTNPWRNRLIGDKIKSRGFKDTWTTSPMIDKYDPVPIISKDAKLIPSGISQPIRIFCIEMTKN